MSSLHHALQIISARSATDSLVWKSSGLLISSPVRLVALSIPLRARVTTTNILHCKLIPSLNSLPAFSLLDRLNHFCDCSND